MLILIEKTEKQKLKWYSSFYLVQITLQKSVLTNKAQFFF